MNERNTADHYSVTMDFTQCPPTDQLLPGTIHDMKNQLMMMKSAYSLSLKCHQKDAEHYYDIFRQSADRLSEMLETLSGTAMGQQNGTIFLNQLVQDLRPAFSALSQKDVRLRYSLKALPDTLYGNALGIKNALMNLVLNALYFTEDGGSVDIGTYNEEGMVCLSVKDTGAGISAEHLENIFTPRFTTRAQGKGLGLAMVLETVTSMGGFVRVHSTPGKGSEFTLFLAEYTPVQSNMPALPGSGVYA